MKALQCDPTQQRTHALESPPRRRLNFALCLLGMFGLLMSSGCRAVLVSRDSSRTLALVEAYLEEHEFTGVVLIARGDEILIHRGYGMAIVEGEVPNTPATLFPIMSITKPFTVIAILQLCERALLDLHDPVDRYLPDFPNGDRITIHHLLTHTAGLPGDLQPIPPIPLPVADALDAYTESQFQFTPGAAYGYSNLGYQTLALIIETVSGQPYDVYLHEHVFQPLGMAQTAVAVSPLVRDDVPSGYSRDGNTLIPVSSFNDAATTRIGAGGIFSTSGDLYRWARSLGSNQLLSESSRAAMFTAQVASASGGAGYGYSWGIIEDQAIVWHTGADAGFYALVYRNFEKDLTIIGLSNGDSTAPLMFDLLSFHAMGWDLKATWIVRLLPILSVLLVAAAGIWLTVLTRGLRNRWRVIEWPSWQRLAAQVVLPVTVGIMGVGLNLQPLRVIGSLRVTLLIAPAWGTIMVSILALLLLILVVAFSAFTTPTIGSSLRE